MPLMSLLYVSTSTLTADDAMHEVASIVVGSRIFNATVEITGALLFTGTHFAQILEGREAPVEALLQSIQRDSRHRDLLVVQRGFTRMRRFSGWDMAYSGSSTGVASYVARVLDAPADDVRAAAARALTNLMVEFVG